MKNNGSIKNNSIIPEHELEISTSRAGGPGGQHVNKSNTKITVRWNIPKTTAFTEEQKAHLMEKLKTQLTVEGDLVIHNSSSRSQLHNKKRALAQLAKQIEKALHVPKKRMRTMLSGYIKEKRLQQKKQQSMLKKTRQLKWDE